MFNQYQCVCGFIYSEEKGLLSEGINPGTKWEEVDEDFICLICGLSKEDFTKI